MAADGTGGGSSQPAAWRGTVRLRMTLAAVFVVGLALGMGALALVTGLRSALTADVRAAARVQAAQVAGTLAPDRPVVTPTVGVADEELVQVLDAGGDVVAASANVAGRPAVAHLAPGESARVTTPVDEDAFVAVAVAARTPDGPVTVIVARALADVLESTQAATRLLAIGIPVLLALVAVGTWTLVGRALAPVEAVRRQVDGISGGELHHRVPQPAGADEIARLAATMNRMLDRLEHAQLGQRRFISDASHELRSPVAAIRQHAEVALAHPDRTTLAELAGTVLAEDLRVQRLVEDLLLLARADEHTLLLRRRAVDLDDLVLDEARRLRAGTPLQVDTSAVSAGRVVGDEAGLRRLLRNLGDNAARHARGRIALRLADGDGTVVLTVEDDGPGIPEAERGRVLERFVRLADARARDDGGSGLGLAIVAELAAAHSGSVAVTSGALGGARVDVRLPGGG
jgi:signal transduction histidine kinase